ncbi:MAG: AMP-binding protein [Ilumatobacteraceae bacterium]
MHPGRHAAEHPDRACFVMAGTGDVVTYGEFDERCNRLAHLFRAHGLGTGAHYSIFMENNDRYLEACGAGERSGLHYTCINSHLTADELAYIVDNSESQILITSARMSAIALDALAQCPRVSLCLVVGGVPASRAGVTAEVVAYETATSAMASTPIDDERLGAAMLYSSGTTGRPKGIIRQLADVPPGEMLPVMQFLLGPWRYREGMVYLSPAPLYHSAPQAAVGLTVRMGGTAIIMEHFDPEEYLALVERYHVTHSQLVPTMFNRMLKLPADVREKYDLSSLEAAIHAAAPCPIPVKERMIEWWGPIIHEYYGATEAIGFTACDSHEWLAHRGTVGRVLLGEMSILDDDLQPCPVGTPGTIWFRTPTPLQYFHDPEKSRAATSPDGTLATTGDVGYVDADGYLYLTDRKSFMIISGGVNIYPQETENLLVTHPKVADAAVFGVPNADLGEEVKAVVQPMPGVEPGPALERELIDFCQQHLSRQKCPRTVDFDPELPRLPTGKLYKRVLRDRYWGDQLSRISQPG